jgi:hypothetical protein
MGIFTMGFLQGAANQYLRASGEKAAQEREDQLRKEDRDREDRLIREQREWDKTLQGREVFFKEQLNEQQAMLTEAANERNLFAQENLQRESFRMQQEAQNARRENAIIETFGYVALQDSEELGIKRGQFIGRDVVGVERRLPDPTEIGIELQRRIQNNIPTMLDPSLFSIPGLDNMLKRLQGSSAGVGGMGPRWGSDPEFPNGSYIRLETNDKGEQEEKLVVVPGTKPGQGDKGAASLANINFIMDTMGPDMTTIMNDFKSGNVGPGSTYRVFTSMIQPHLANAYTEALRTGAKDANGNIVIKNPIDLFDISNRIKGQKEQKFFLEELLPQVLLGFTKSEILEMAGIPQDAMQDIVEFENLVVLPNPDKFSNIVTDQTADGKKGIKPEIKKKLVEIQEFSGLSLTRLSALINDAKDPLAALNQMIEKREIIRAGVVQSSSTISVTQTARDVVQDTVTKNKYNVEEGIAFVRATIEDNPAAKPARIVQSGTTGQIAPVYDNRITKYGFDSKDARAMSDASRRAKLIADRMLELRSSGLGGVGLISLVTNLVGGARDIADALTKLATQYNMEPDVAAKFQERAELLKQAGSLKDQQIDMDTVIGGQKVFDLLGEQLAFAMAAAVQGGEGGRAISDRDVEAQRAVLGLRGILASNTGVERNLRYISQEMERAAVINDQYAKSIDEEDFQAVYIYDQSITRARTIDELTSGAPVLPSEDARVQDQEMILIDGVLTPVAR